MPSTANVNVEADVVVGLVSLQPDAVDTPSAPVTTVGGGIGSGQGLRLWPPTLRYWPCRLIT